MERHQEHVPHAIYSLADHLDTVLAAAEDLLGLDAEDVQSDQLLRLELVAITHVLQARQHLRELRFDEPVLAGQSVLFIVGTDAFESGHAKSAQPLVEPTPLTEDYLIGRRISIRTLIGLASGMLDALEQCYVLYQQEGEAELPGTPTAAPLEIWTSASASSPPQPTKTSASPL